MSLKDSLLANLLLHNQSPFSLLPCFHPGLRNNANSPKTCPSCRRRCRGCKSCEVRINLRSRSRGVRIQGRKSPRSQCSRGRALSHNKQHKQTLHSLRIRYSIVGGIVWSPAAEHHNNNANIEDRWVPHVPWLWTASRIKSGTDSRQLKQS